MKDQEKKYLYDIVLAITNIFDIHLKDLDSAVDFSNEITKQRAVERELEILGGAAYKLQKLGFRFNGQDQAINRRNTLIHQYDVTSPVQLWNYIVSELPSLKADVEMLLNKGFIE